MEVSVLTLEQFNKMLREKYNGDSINLMEKIHYFDYTDLNTLFSSKSYIEHLRFVVAYNEKDILGICKFSYWDFTKDYAVSYTSTNKDYKNQGVAKSIEKELFKYFSKEYPNQILAFSGYSIDGWKYLRKYILKYSQEFNVKIKEKSIEYVKEWTDENRKMFDESRKIIKSEY